MNVALITDTHWGVRNDSSVFIEYYKKFYSEYFFPYLDKHGITSIIHLGDIVDRRKYINFVTLRALKDIFINECEKRSIDLHVIIGNHDIPFRNTNGVNAMREIFQHGSNQIVKFYESPTEINVGDIPIALVPWINSENEHETLTFLRDTKAQICLGHLELVGFEMMRGMKQTHGYDTTPFEKFDLVCSGHYHHKSQKGNINYLGAPYEMTWSDYQDPRGFHILDTETRNIDFIQNPFSMFYKIWYDDDGKNQKDVVLDDYSIYENTYVKVIVTSKTNPYWFDLMLDKLYKANPANVSIVDDNKNMDQLKEEEIIDEAEDTMTIMNKYLDNIDINVPRTELSKLLQALYTEAQHLDI